MSEQPAGDLREKMSWKFLTAEIRSETIESVDVLKFLGCFVKSSLRRSNLISPLLSFKRMEVSIVVIWFAKKIRFEFLLVLPEKCQKKCEDERNRLTKLPKSEFAAFRSYRQKLIPAYEQFSIIISDPLYQRKQILEVVWIGGGGYCVVRVTLICSINLYVGYSGAIQVSIPLNNLF